MCMLKKTKKSYDDDNNEILISSLRHASNFIIKKTFATLIKIILTK